MTNYNNVEKEICILCDFVNEPTVDVGYADWLALEFSKENINEVISKKSEIVVFWPNCDTAPPAVMRKRLEDSNCTWKRHVIKIIAQGGWTEMCEQLKNYINCGIAESTHTHTRCTKKPIKRKYTSSDESDDAEEPTIASSKAPKIRKMVENSPKKKGESFNHLINDTTSLDEDDEDLHQYSKKGLVSTIERLRKENRRLRADNARLKALKSVDDDLPEMKKLSSEILQNLRATSVLVNLYSSADSRCCKHDNTVEENDVSATLPRSSVVKKRMRYPEECSADTVENASWTCSSPYKQFETRQLKNEPPLMEEANSFDDQSSIADNCSIHQMSAELNFEDGPKPIPEQEYLAQDTMAGQHYLFGENYEIKNGMVDLGGGCFVDAEQLSKCSRKNATKLTCDVLSLVFTREELATSSLTGKIPNTHLKAGVKAKKKLDPTKIAAISAFVAREFGGTATQGEILTAIKNKCNNTAKAVRRDMEKSIIMAEQNSSIEQNLE